MSTPQSGYQATRINSEHGRHVAFPLGGIGTGNVSLGADGGLRQWQLHNLGNHLGDIPNSFFMIRVDQVEPPSDDTRVLLAPAPARDAPRTPLVNDDAYPEWQRRLLDRATGIQDTTFSAVYPFGEIDYSDDTLPVSVKLEAFTPLVPLDAETSGIPTAMFTFTVHNRGDHDVHGWLGATAQNAVGWDGVTAMDGSRCSVLGGNTNRVRRSAGWTSVVMENASVGPNEPSAGQMVLTAQGQDVRVDAQWSEPEEFLSYVRGLRPGGRQDGMIPITTEPILARGAQPASRPSTPGATWAGGLATSFQLTRGETVELRFALSWHFPNRYVNFPQFGPPHPEFGKSRFWLGNDYANRFADAEAVSEDVRCRWDELRDVSRRWADGLTGSSLPSDVVERMSAQASLLRSPTCFVDGAGTFFGFEGTLGASTTMWNGGYGGSCPLNCTHVWNYEQALSRLFPTLERSMRKTEFEVMQAPEGYLPHRVIVPTYLPQLWDVSIGGPQTPALDGMLGCVLKSYREIRQGAGVDWLHMYWPNVLRLLDHVTAKWDPAGTGMLHGIQPSTHDIDLSGINTYMGTYWLAALRAAEEMAKIVGDEDRAAEFRSRFERGGPAYDDALFNGEYYVQVLEPGDRTDYQWVNGCLSDQLVGQWWAHQLDLGYILPAAHVRTALASVVRLNLREGFRDFFHGFRVYADQDDTGLLVCSWPHGGRPEVPTRYADEVWSGIEYQVAAHCLYEGLDNDAYRVLRGLWARHSGERRNPFNEIECGDHYARALAGWSVLEAATGHRFDALTGRLRLRSVPDAESWSAPILTDTGWGTLVVNGTEATLSCAWGRLTVNELIVDDAAWAFGAVNLAQGQQVSTSTL